MSLRPGTQGIGEEGGFLLLKHLSSEGRGCRRGCRGLLAPPSAGRTSESAAITEEDTQRTGRTGPAKTAANTDCGEPGAKKGETYIQRPACSLVSRRDG